MRESGGPGEASGAGQRGPLSPVWAFILLGAVATIVPLAILATRPEPARSTPPATRSPDYSLTDAEAIAEFERLNASLMAAYRERNIALAESIFTSDSPMLPRVRKEIRQLIESSVLSRTRFQRLSLDLIKTSEDEVEIAVTQILTPRFVAAPTGDDVTSDASTREKQKSVWTIRVEAGAWRLHNAIITDIKALDT